MRPDVTGDALDEMRALNALDWSLILVVLWSTGRAFMRGATREIAALLGAAVGLLLAGLEYHTIGLRLQHWVPTRVADLLGFLLVFLVAVMVFSFAGRLLRSGVRAVGLGLADRGVGACLGFTRGVLLGSALLLMWVAFLPQSRLLVTSRLAPYLLAAAHAVSSVLPQQLRYQLDAGTADFARTRAGWLGPLPEQTHDRRTRDEDGK